MSNLARTLRWLRGQGVWIYGTVETGGTALGPRRWMSLQEVGAKELSIYEVLHFLGNEAAVLQRSTRGLDWYAALLALCRPFRTLSDFRLVEKTPRLDRGLPTDTSLRRTRQSRSGNARKEVASRLLYRAGGTMPGSRNDC